MRAVFVCPNCRRQWEGQPPMTKTHGFPRDHQVRNGETVAAGGRCPGIPVEV